MLAAAALLVSRRVWLPEEPVAWSPGLAFYSGHSQQDLGPTVSLLAKMLLRAPVSKYQVRQGLKAGTGTAQVVCLCVCVFICLFVRVLQLKLFRLTQCWVRR